MKLEVQWLNAHAHLIWMYCTLVLIVKRRKERDIGAKYVDLDTLLKNADFITINAAYNPSLHHMIDTEQFNKMKSTAYLINAGRGPIVNEQSLVEALDNKVIEGAALDVYEFEPEITDALKSFKNVVLTPSHW